MVNKKISKLDAIVSVAAADLFEVEPSTGAPSKKATLTQVMASEVTTRTANDNSIITGIGANADGSYNTPVGTNYLDATTDVMDALETLDTAIAGLGTSDLRVGSTTFSAAQIRDFGTEKVLIDLSSFTASANGIIEVISIWGYLNSDGTAFANGNAAGSIKIFYDSKSEHFAEFDIELLITTACITHKGKFTSNVEMLKNQDIMIKCDANPTLGGSSTLVVYYTFRVVTLGTCAV